MPRNPRYDLLFEPVRIGPKVAPNRFYQTPHATGMGYLKPRSGAALRGIKAEGGWGVVCTEYCSIHPTSDDSPYAFLSLWDDDDVAALAKTAEAIHAHGSLAGVELWHGGLHANNRLTREPPVAPSGQPVHYPQPGHARALDRSDIKALRGWQVAAAKRARSAGFDIVYVYAGHDYLPFQFLSPTTNRRGDEYGGSLVNRVRLLREMIEETREAVGHDCAVAVRLGVDELLGPQGITAEGEGCEILSLLAELPDLWDVNLAGGLGNDSTSARFSPEGFQERYVGFVKQVTTKPVVSVGRFTSPDAMLDQVKRGILDFVGAARPSIADPFLPRKIDEGREDEIRECIGCNICRSANNEGVPLRCTQNPTIGEEWRRGWHPERVPAGKPESVLVVGGGPAGLEATRVLAERGYRVTLAEAGEELGGRVSRESRLPGLAEWARVRDYRLQQVEGHAGVEIYRASRLAAADALGVGARHLLIATGAAWRRDGRGRWHGGAVPGTEGEGVFTPDDVMAGRLPPDGPVLLYDDDHYYMGTVVALALRRAGLPVLYLTTSGRAGSWGSHTAEQWRGQAALLEAGIEILPNRALSRWQAGEAESACIFTGRTQRHAAASLLTVTSREPDDALWRALAADPEALREAGVETLRRIGDCHAPGIIAAAVYAGHKAARELGEAPAEALRERA